MLGALLITLREGLEAALIVGIILAYLTRTANRRAVRSAWLGVAAAVVASLAAGGAIYVTAGEISGPAEPIFEGAATLLAAAVLTWMILWMRRQAVNIKASLQAQIDSALAGGSTFGVALLAFIAVVREGIETVLFLFAANGVAESRLLFAIGGLLGLGAAVAIGYVLYKGSARLNLKAFFNITGIVLVVFAAGLLAHAIGEFQEAGVVPTGISQVWDTSRVLSQESTLGHFLEALFGYTSRPSLTQAVGYFVFLAGALALYLRPSRRRPADQLRPGTSG